VRYENARRTKTTSQFWSLLAEDDVDLGAGPQYAPQRRGDLVGRQHARRHLVRQRLEEVEVAAIDQGHVHGRVAQRENGLEAAEAAADDHDSVGGAHRYPPSSLDPCG